MKARVAAKMRNQAKETRLPEPQDAHHAGNNQYVVCILKRK